MSEQQPTLLVTGASGHLGRRVVELLLEAQAGTIVATTRTPEKLSDFSQRGVIVRQADFDDPESLVPAFTGVDKLLLISTDVLGIPGKRIQQHTNAVKAAEKAGVKHVVYTSIMNPGPESPIVVAHDHRETEAAMKASGMGWTMLRNNIYADMLLGSLGQAIQMGKLFSAAGDGKAAYVTREDCARAAAAALADSFMGQRALDITGPEAVSQADLAKIASEISGQEVTYIPLEVDVLVDNMVNAGLPRPLAEGLATFDTGIAQGLLGDVSNAFEELTGSKPTSVAEFLASNREALLQVADAH
ncbi:MAG: SDR family oxidoreductase [Anaerolineae bacterium]|nr:SDR family oxidoreductase [Anaerolineae bacterium]